MKDEFTVSKKWLEKTMNRFMWLGTIGGFVAGALIMFLICHFRWELLG